MDPLTSRFRCGFPDHPIAKLHLRFMFHPPHFTRWLWAALLEDRPKVINLQLASGPKGHSADWPDGNDVPN